LEAFEVAAPGGFRPSPDGGLDPRTLVPSLTGSERGTTRRRAWRWVLYRSRMLTPVPIVVALSSPSNEGSPKIHRRARRPMSRCRLHLAR
jgi:hypothetical protein